MSTFKFKHFSVKQASSAMKVGTDAMVLGALVHKQNISSILEIGSGTGVIGLMLAQKFHNAQVLGVELDKEAAAECKDNFNNSPWSDRMEIIHGNVKELNFEKAFDLIISNPPFFQNALPNTDDRATLARHVSDLTPDVLSDFSQQYLTELGEVWLIIPYLDRTSWTEAFKRNGLNLTKRIEISGVQATEPNRSVLVFSNQKTVNIDLSKLSIRDKDGNYSEEYIELTKDYHGVSLR
jgi:tRNA1Val (adenine37-N6)-methyltransferase